MRSTSKELASVQSVNASPSRNVAHCDAQLVQVDLVPTDPERSTYADRVRAAGAAA